MSSDSEDEFSYTNSASLFKKISKKVHEEIPDILNLTAEEIEFNGNKRKSDVLSDSECCVTLETRAIKRKNNTINLISPSTSHEVTSNTTLDDSLDVIGQIDACLERNQRGRGRRKSLNRSHAKTRGKKKKNTISPRRTRQSQKQLLASQQQVIASIELDVDYPEPTSYNFINLEPLKDNTEITVKVLWKSQNLKRFEVRKYQKLDVIFKHFAEQENISEELLFFTFKDNVVCKTDTPAALNLNAASIIEGGILSSKTHLSSGYKNENIELKVQWRNLKNPLSINMKVTDTMTVLMSKCAQQMKVPVNKLKFHFDGDTIEATDSPMSLQLEGGECIDCILKET